MLSSVPVFLAVAAFTPLASAHIAFWHKSMYGFNVSAQTYSYDNRPQTPLQDYTFDQWWFHGHLDHPPNDGDFFELPAGQSVNTELSCDKGTTSWFDSAPGGNSGYPTNYPCVGQPTSEFHTTGFDDVKGCALAISYKSDASSVQPEDFAVFSVNHTCVWYQNTAFQVPADMPPCPEGGCTCAWFWIHSPDSGSEQNYMNGFKCKVTGSTSNTAIGKPAVPRRCGADTNNGRQQATPSNCTAGPKQPFYWYQKERNTLFEGTYSPPFYLPLYNFEDGAQNDIFQEATVGGVPVFGGSGSAPVVSSAPAASSTPVTPSSTPASAPSSQAPAPSSQAPAPSSQAPTPSSQAASPAPSSQAPAPAPSSQAAAPAPSSQAADPVPSSSPAPAPSSQAPPAASPSPAQPTTQASSQAPIPTPAPASPIAAPVQASSAVASQASSAPPASSTKQCKSKKKKRAAKNATLNARHDAIKRHVKRRLSQDELH